MKQPISIIGLLFGICVTFWTKEFADFIMTVPSPEPSHLYKGVLFVAGLAFLFDILCILWWYANYIYRVQPESTLFTHFLDFTIVGMFALAAGKWLQPFVFLIATTFGSIFLFIRFNQLKKHPQATFTDLYILRRALVCLLAVCPFSIIVLLLVLVWRNLEKNMLGVNVLGGHALGVTGMLLFSSIGIVLTVYLYRKIDIAATLHDVPQTGLSAMLLKWPTSMATEDRTLIRDKTTKGLRRFSQLFEDNTNKTVYERLKSRVHAEADLVIQSYILSLSSVRDHRETEIENKAFMVGLSHWLDDLIDGRSERQVARQLPLIQQLLQIQPGQQVINEKDNRKLFDAIYAPLVMQHTDKNVFDKLKSGINDAVPASQRRSGKSIWPVFGLNRVALGALLFTQSLPKATRDELLESHNKFLCNLAVTSAKEAKWKHANKLKSVLTEMLSDRVGKLLLGLTTKTTQEIALASEDVTLPFFVTVLHSLLYAPPLYYHDINHEIEHGEMLPLQDIDVDFDPVLKWLPQVRELQRSAHALDARAQYRDSQFEMAYLCFAHTVPSTVCESLRPVYVKSKPHHSPAP